MTNMSYCRFENTVNDLEDCEEHFTDELSSEHEIRARKRLLAVCKRIAELSEEDLAVEEDEEEEEDEMIACRRCGDMIRDGDDMDGYCMDCFESKDKEGTQ